MWRSLGSGGHADVPESQPPRPSEAVWRSSAQEHRWADSGECRVIRSRTWRHLCRNHVKLVFSKAVFCSQEALAPYKHIEEDLKSLKEVLEMKNQQIHQQDIKISELEKIVSFEWSALVKFLMERLVFEAVLSLSKLL